MFIKLLPCSAKSPICPAAPHTVTIIGSAGEIWTSARRRAVLPTPLKQAVSRLPEVPMAMAMGWKAFRGSSPSRKNYWMISNDSRMFILIRFGVYDVKLLKSVRWPAGWGSAHWLARWSKFVLGEVDEGFWAIMSFRGGKKRGGKVQ